MRSFKAVVYASLLIMTALIVPALFATPVSAQVSSTSTVDSIDDVGMFSSIAVDSNGFVHMVYHNATSHTLKYANNSLGYWSVETVANGTGYWKGEYCSIALDSYDHPHISYLVYEVATGDSWVGYRNKTTSWSNETWIGNEAGYYNGYYTDIAIDPSNNVHIVYGYYDGEFAYPYYATNVGGSFSVEIIQSSDYSYGGSYNSIAIGPNGVPQVATWGTQTDHGAESPNPSAPGADPNLGLWYAVRSETSWSFTQVEAGDVGVGAQIAVDSIDRAHISYESNATQYIRYAHQEVAGGAFTLENVKSNGGDAHGGYTGIAVDSEKQVFISYQRVQTSGPLTHCYIEVAAFRNGAWTFDLVDQGSVFYLSFHTSIATDSDGRAHLAYFGSILNDAKYAKLIYVPTAPGELQSTGGDGKIALAWPAPALDGGSAITGWKICRGTSPGGETLYDTIGIATLPYNDTDVAWGVTYYYKISAVNAVGDSPLSVEDSATPTATAPGLPGDLLAAPGNAQVTLTWSAAADHGSAVTNYKVYRGLTSGDETLHVTLGNVLTCTDTSLANGQTYFYRISASNSVGEGAQSNELSVTPMTVPLAPTIDSATPGDTQVVLTWSAPIDDGGASIIGYKVYRGTAPGGEELLVTTGNVLIYTDISLANGQTYYYKISAVNSAGEGGQSNELSAEPTGPPTAPQDLQAIPGDFFINLTWQAPSADGGSAIADYLVYRGTTSGAEMFLASAGLNLWFNDTGLTNGQTYYYMVRAENAQGIGPNSTEASATPSPTVTVPSAPRNLRATPGISQVNLEWSAPANNGGAPITNYSVYRGTSLGGETLLTTLGNVLTYTDTGLTNGQTYWFKVSAVNYIGEGTSCPAISATPSYDFDYRLINGDTEVEITGYHGPGGFVSIPGTIDGKPVTSIGDHAFDSCMSLTSMTIPIGVTSIGDSAFYYCTSLASVTIPIGVTSLGDYSFYYCYSLTSITIPIGVTYIGNHAFAVCTSLTSVIIPSSVTSIGSYAFASCTSLTSVTIPDPVISLEEHAFAGSKSSTLVDIPASATSIGDHAFSHCTALTSVTMGSGITSIGDGTFYNCTSLTSVIVPIGVTSIGNYAFAVCTTLTSVTIGSNVTSIGNGAFYSCTSLTSITFLVLDAPTTVGEDWILGTDAAIRGHAYPNSNFPAPGGVFYGLTMGAVISENSASVGPGSDSMMLTMLAVIAIAAVLVAVLFVLRKHKSKK